MMFNAAELMPLLPEILLACSAMAMLVGGAFLGNSGTPLLFRLSMLAFLSAIILLFGLEWNQTTVLNGFFLLDGFTEFAKILILLGMIGVTAISLPYLQKEQMVRFEYPVLLTLAALGMCLMVSAQNLLAVYLALELQSLSLYILAAFNRNHSKSAEAGLKYFVLGALASGLMLFGMSLVYGFSGGLIGFAELGQFLSAPGSASPGLMTGMALILIGVAFKISAVPFHMWTPDVYEGAPTSVTTLMAVVPKLAAIVLLIRLAMIPFASLEEIWQPLIWGLAAASMIWAAFAALRQNNIKRLMAYSSIGHMGYGLIGLATGTIEGAGALMLYMLVYMVMGLGTFGIILLMRRNDVAVESIDDLAGLVRNHPVLAYALAFFMLSMGGIPPFAGFFSKLLIFQSAMSEGLIILAVIGVLTSVVAAYYYLRVIKVAFFDEPADRFDDDMTFAQRVVLLVTAGFVLLFVFMPQPLIDLCMGALVNLAGLPEAVMVGGA